MEFEYPICLKDVDRVAKQMDERIDKDSIEVKNARFEHDRRTEAQTALRTTEQDIKKEQHNKMVAYWARKGKVWLGAVLFTLVSSAAFAQTQTIEMPLPSNLGIGWQHDGLNTAEYVVILDANRFSVGKPAPTSGTTYAVVAPPAFLSALTVGSHQLSVSVIGTNGVEIQSPKVTIIVTAPVPNANPVTGVTISITLNTTPPPVVH